MSNVIELSAFKGPKRDLDSHNDDPTRFRATGRPYRRSGRNMHNLVFRSYTLIMEAPEADLVRDVRINTDKAKVKLRKIREQIVIDRNKAAARADLMSKAEAKLSAAIEEARSLPPTPAPSLEVNQPRANGEALTRRREFKLAMRQRIRDIAASRDLSEEEIKPALTLKHHEIANFTEKHGVNLEWLLEGKGRVFKKGPIVPNPNMTAREFAAIVATLPEAEQQKISAIMRQVLIVRGVLEERGP